MGNREQILIDKIIADAEARAAALIREADELAGERLEEAKKVAETRHKSAVEDAEKQGAELIRHRVSMCELDIKRGGLRARRGVVDGVFEEASGCVHRLKAGEYVALVSRMIKKHAQDGDEVLIGEGDENRMTAETVADISKAAGIKLTLAKGTGNFRGGVMLLGKTCDKNLTFDRILGLLREDLEAEAARILFGNIT